MDAEAGLSRELTTLERIEHLLTVVACNLTGTQPHVLLPWKRAGVSQFMEAVDGRR